MNEESSAIETVTPAVGAPDSDAPTQAPTGQPFWGGGLLIALAIVGAVVASNLWLRRRAERDESE